MGDSLETTDSSTADAQSVSHVEYDAFANYIRKVIQIFFDEEFIPPAFNFALEDRSTQECIRKFISDPQVQALFIQRCSSKGKCKKFSNQLPDVGQVAWHFCFRKFHYFF